MSRREAKAVPEKDLSDSQILAIERIAKALSTSLSNLTSFIEAQGSSPRKFEPNGPANQTFFVSGEPGTGKTSVHLTLRQFLERDGPEVPERFSCTKQLLKDARRLVWLDPLDLGSEGEATNFLAAVLVRISAVMEQGGPDGYIHRPSFLDDEPLQDLYRVQNDLLLAWDSMHPQRATQVDPEVLAQEVLRAEQAKFRVNDRLEKVLRAFLPGDRREPSRGLGSAGSLKPSSRSTVFVLPVDDFYLKPKSSLEFLRLLRMISVPELFVIVTGDLDVIKELLYQDRLGLLVTLAGETLQTRISDSAGLTARAGALTSQSLQKLIPLAQRTVLEFMNNLTALDFIPEDGENKLEKLLEEVILDSPEQMSVVYDLGSSSVTEADEKIPESRLAPRLSPQNLSEFLLVPAESCKRSDPYPYSGLAILDLPPRDIADLWHSLEELLRRSAEADRDQGAGHDRQSSTGQSEDLPDRVLKFVITHVRQALDHDAFLTETGKDACWSAIDGVFWKPFLMPAKLRFASRGATRGSIRINEDTSLLISDHLSWVIGPAHPESISGYAGEESDEPQGQAGHTETATRQNRNLSPRPAAWFTVLYDLMVMWDRVRLPAKVGRHEQGRIPSEPLGWASFHSLVARDSLPHGEGEDACRGHVKPGDKFQCSRTDWPVPPWLALRQIDLLGYEWNDTLKRFDETVRQRNGSDGEEGRCNPVAWLIYHWTMPITRQLRGVVPSDEWRIPKENEPWCIPDASWAALEESIRDLRNYVPRRSQDFTVDRPGARREVAAAWIEQLEVFLNAPLVLAVPGEFRERLLSALKIQDPSVRASE